MNDTDFSKAGAWKSEVERSRNVAEPHWADWEENLQYYQGFSPDAAFANQYRADWVNINADFVNCEVKLSQLFYEQPDLQLTAKGQFRTKPPAMQLPGQPPVQQLDGPAVIQAHRQLLNELLGPDHADVLPTIHASIKDCLVTAGVGACKIGYAAAIQQTEPPEQLGNILNLQQSIPVPVDEKWFWDRIPSKKYRIPADFNDTDFDRAAWLGENFRWPLSVAQRLLKLPAEFTGTTNRDDLRLNTASGIDNTTSGIPYVEGVEIWYKAALFDDDVIHPEVIRRHILVSGLDEFAEQSTESPYQTILPNGRLSADSMRGYPIHVLAIRTVPDSAYVPSDSSMTRPLIRELCKFRTQQVQERDANIPKILYDAEKLPPDVIAKIEAGQIGALIPVPSDSLVGGAQSIMQQVAQGTQTRGSYVANDYIQRDLDKTLGIDPVGAGIQSQKQTTATEIGIVDRQRSVRLDAERRKVLAWWLKGVQKFSALVCRYMTPQLAATYIGQEQAQLWAQWDKKTFEGRLVFTAKPDSQIRLDAATERKFALDLYQFMVKDPHINGMGLRKNLLEKAGMNPTENIVEQVPPNHPPPSVSFTFKGEDLIGPQAQQVREILAQSGLQISQQSIDATATQMFQQVALGHRDASGQAIPAAMKPAEHGGVSEKVRPLDQQSADSSAQRVGMNAGPRPQ